MKLSVIIISYNEARYLAQAIDSCLTQKRDFELEIIIGDDGSSDGSIDIIKDYHHNYPKLIKYFVVDRGNPTNVIPSLRVSNVIKRGFAMATGEYLMVLSGDDLLIDREKCQKQIRFLKQHHEYSSTYTNYQKFWDDGKKEVINTYPLSSNSLFWSRYYVHITCFVFRRKVLENLAKNFCDDTGLIFSILKTGKIKYLPIVAFGYRQRPVSIMSSSNTTELALLEILLLQDLLDCGGYLFSTLARYSKPLTYLYGNRNSLSNQKYSKWINNSNEYRTNLIGALCNYDKMAFWERMKLRSLIVGAVVARKFFALASLKDRLAHR